MKHTLLAAVLLLAAARQASAVWVETRIGPKSLQMEDRNFSIRSKPRDGYVSYEVTVSPRRKPLSPFAGAKLTLVHGDRSVAVVPVASRWKNGSVTFWFRVSPAALAGSRFDYHEQAYTPSEHGSQEGDPERSGRYEMVLGGQAFYFFTRDFAPEK